MFDEKSKAVYVTSYNQSGGITANNVYFEKPPRSIAQIKGVLDQVVSAHLTKNKMINMPVIDEPEPMSHAHEIKEYLISKGCKISNFIRGMLFSPGFTGTTFEEHPDAIVIKIGRNV